MSVQKVSKKEWSKKIETSVRKREFEQELERSINKKLRWNRIKKNAPFPLGIGIITCLLVAKIYGWYYLGEIVFSWIIGITFVSFLLSWIGVKLK